MGLKVATIRQNEGKIASFAIAKRSRLCYNPFDSCAPMPAGGKARAGRHENRTKKDEDQLKKTLAFLVLAMFAIALSGCATPAATQGLPTQTPADFPSAYTDANKIPYDPDQAIEGAAGVEREGDHQNSRYYVHHDFFNMTSDDTLTILPKFKTQQQATEWTCGPTSALMVLEHFQKRGDLFEMDLVALRQKDQPGATNLQQMINIFDALGGFEYESTYDYKDNLDAIESTMLLDYLKKGIPVIIGWDEWGGHWQVVIGYDTMGTETEIDDVLIIADPYDTTDHDQDGYVIQSFERFYYNWLNSFDPDFESHVFLAVWPEGYQAAQ